MKCYRCTSWPCTCRDGITLVHGDCREVLPHLPIAEVVLTDPPYGIEGGRGGDRRLGKAKYDSSWSDTPEYIRSVVVPVITSLAKLSERMAVTPGLRCWRDYCGVLLVSSRSNAWTVGIYLLYANLVLRARPASRNWTIAERNQCYRSI